MTWGGGWVNRWKQAATGLGGFVKNGLGATIDLATGVPSWDFTSAGNEYTKMMSGLGNFLSGTKGVLGWGGDALAWVMNKDQEIYSHAISQPISTLFNLKGVYTSETWAKQHGYDRHSFTDNVTKWFDPDLYKSAWHVSQHISPGQAAVYFFTGTDVMDPRDVSDTQRQWWFNLVSGGTDAVTSMSLDPLGKLSKFGTEATGINKTTRTLPEHLSAMGDGMKVGRVHPPTAAPELPAGNVPTPDWEFGKPKATPPEDTSLPSAPALEQGGPTPNWRFGQRPEPTTIPGEVVGQSDRLSEYITAPKSPIAKTLDWAEQKVQKLKDPALAAKAIAQHPMLRDSSKGGLIATMLANSNAGEKELLMKVALGDADAYYQLAGRRGVLGEEIAGKRADLAKLQQQADDMRDDLIRSELPTDAAPGKIPSTVDKSLNADRISTLQDEITALEKRESWINDVIGKAVNNEADVRGSTAGIRSALVGSVPKGGVFGPVARGAADVRFALDRASQRAGISEKWHYYNQFNTPIRLLSTAAASTLGGASHLFVDKRPGAFLDTNDPESWRNLDYMLRRVKGFDTDRRNTLVGKYMAATGDGAKLQAANNAEAEVIKHIAAQNGIEPDEIQPIINQFMSSRQAFKARLTDRAYSSTLDEQGRRIDFVDNENVPTSILPELRTQLVNRLPLADVDTIQRAMARNKWSIKASSKWTKPRTFNEPDTAPTLLNAAFKTKDFAVDASDFLSSWWKATNLMRLGYTVKMLTDDELAYMAKLGAMGQLHNLALGTGNYVRNRVRNIQATTRAVRSGRLTAEYEALGPKRMLGQEDVPIYSSPGGLGKDPGELLATGQGMFPRGDLGDHYRALNGESRDLLMRSEDGLIKDARKSMSHGFFKPGQQGHLESWVHALNTQLGQDTMARRLLAGDSEESVVQWLRSDPEGRAYARDLPFRSADPERWVHNVARMVDHYAPAPELRQAALDRNVTRGMVKEWSKDTGIAPEVHGGLLDFNMGKGTAAGMLKDFRNGFFKFMSQMPTDVLVRHPLAQSLYQARLQDLVRRWDASGGTVDNIALRQFENQARLHAIKETKKVVFDLTNHSNAAHVFRFIAPFYAPWEETLKRWGRLAYGNPGILFQGNRMWQSFNHIAGTQLQDENGDPITGLTGIGGADKQLITFRLPESLSKKIPGLEVLNGIQIPKSSLNMTLQGDPWWLPGFGPFVQVPTSELVKDKPQWYQSVKFLLPFGPQKISDLILPNTARRFNQLTDEDDTSYATTKIRIYQTRYAQWIRNGRNGPPPDPTDPAITRDAQRLHGLQWFVSAALPFTAKFNSPYKFYIDQYHKLLADKNLSKQWNQNAANYERAQRKYPNLPIGRDAFGAMSARDEFISRYPDFFMFADSVSKNNAGIPASIDALKASKKYAALIKANPDLAPVIIGAAGQTGGEFDPAVYQYQMGQKLGESGKHFRDPQSLPEFAHGAMVSQGWNEYMKQQNILRAALAERGLRSFQQNGAEDLSQLRDKLTESLANKNPDWFQEFSGNASAAQMTANLQGLQKIAAAPSMRGRQDIATLNQYLAMRQVFERVLASRKAAGGAGTLQAISNQDLLMAWEALRDNIAESDTVFQANIFDRFLSGDTNLTAIAA